MAQRVDWTRKCAPLASSARSRTSEIKEKAHSARCEKEAALKIEEDRLAAEVEATRVHLVKTVANIPRVSGSSYVRPEPPKIEELDLNPELAEVFGGNKANSPIAVFSLVADFVFAGVAITAALLILQNISSTLN